MKKCIACGMPMTSRSEFAMGDTSKDYCRHCMRPDGSMQSFAEKLTSMTEFIVRTQGLDASVAERSAKAMLRELPAWEHYFDHGS